MNSILGIKVAKKNGGVEKKKWYSVAEDVGLAQLLSVESAWSDTQRKRPI